MRYTVEDTLEILSGIKKPAVHVRIDQSDRNLITSLGRQVWSGLALTDRQLDLSLAKIAKYREGLAHNNVDVDVILLEKSLRMPLRSIDRSQSIYISVDPESKAQRIYIKYTFSKKLGQIWDSIKNNLDGYLEETKNIRSILATEKNLYAVVTAFKSLDFVIDPEVEEMYEKIDEILKNSENYEMAVDLDNDQCVIKNANKYLLDAVSNVNQKFKNENLFVNIDRLKNFGIFQKSPKIVEKINSSNLQQLTKDALFSNSSRIRINPEKYSLDDMIKTINELNQWPVLVILDDNNKIYNS